MFQVLSTFFEYFSALQIAERFIDRMDLNAAEELAKSVSPALHL